MESCFYTHTTRTLQAFDVLHNIRPFQNYKKHHPMSVGGVNLGELVSSERKSQAVMNTKTTAHHQLRRGDCQQTPTAFKWLMTCADN